MPLEVLLVGGSGFMGSHVARELLAAGHGVTVLSRGRRAPVAGRSLTADRRDRESLAAALRGRRFDLTVDFLAYDASDLEMLCPPVSEALGRYLMISSGQVYLITEGSTPPFREHDAAGPITREPPAGTRDHREWSYGVG